jgi:RimJ/RimL family protein N-acetyltransferase
MEDLRLETERLVLRLPRLEDAPAAAEYLADPEAMRFLGGSTVPPEDAPAVVRKWMRRWESEGVGPFVLERREDGVFVGRCGILVWDSRDWTQSTFAEAGEHARPELGWTLVRRHWGNGYATEAAFAARDWARAERGFTRLISLVNPANVASQRVAERLGAQPVETVELFDSGPADVWLHPAAA